MLTTVTANNCPSGGSVMSGIGDPPNATIINTRDPPRIVPPGKVMLTCKWTDKMWPSDRVTDEMMQHRGDPAYWPPTYDTKNDQCYTVFIVDEKDYRDWLLSFSPEVAHKFATRFPHATLGLIPAPTTTMATPVPTPPPAPTPTATRQKPRPRPVSRRGSAAVAPATTTTTTTTTTSPSDWDTLDMPRVHDGTIPPFQWGSFFSNVQDYVIFGWGPEKRDFLAKAFPLEVLEPSSDLPEDIRVLLAADRQRTYVYVSCFGVRYVYSFSGVTYEELSARRAASDQPEKCTPVDVWFEGALQDGRLCICPCTHATTNDDDLFMAEDLPASKTRVLRRTGIDKGPHSHWLTCPVCKRQCHRNCVELRYFANTPVEPGHPGWTCGRSRMCHPQLSQGPLSPFFSPSASTTTTTTTTASPFSIDMLSGSPASLFSSPRPLVSSEDTISRMQRLASVAGVGAVPARKRGRPRRVPLAKTTTQQQLQQPSPMVLV